MLRHSRLSALLPVLFLPLAVFVCAGCAMKPVIDPSATITRDEAIAPIRAALQHGDWLVTRGVHITDNLVATATNTPLSHAVIYDASNDTVIESEAQGVHATPLLELLAKSHRVLVMRPMWATEETREPAVRRARELIGSGYDYTGLVGLGLPDRYYCTELAVAAYEPFMEEQPANPIPRVIKPGQMFHWGRIVYDSGP
jgi:hypothetical protein